MFSSIRRVPAFCQDLLTKKDQECLSTDSTKNTGNSGDANVIVSKLKICNQPNKNLMKRFKILYRPTLPFGVAKIIGRESVKEIKLTSF